MKIYLRPVLLGVVAPTDTNPLDPTEGGGTYVGGATGVGGEPDPDSEEESGGGGGGIGGEGEP